MDQITLDVTDAPGSLVWVGAEVEIAGTDRASPNFLPRLAQEAGSIAHEFLCRIGPRVERAYRYPALTAPGAAKAVGASAGADGVGGAAAVA